jgi:Family of unknown function (DUF6582)
MATTRLKPFHLFVPFETIERREEDGAYIVEGYAFCNEVVGGEGGVRLKRSAMEAATPDYLRFGAIREMHQPIAAGTCLQATWDDKGCRLRAEIVDDQAIKKIERKVYKGFSVGVNPTGMTPDRVVESCEWPETSLVDRPKDPDALFLHRAATLDPDAEVEVEVLPDRAIDPLPNAGLPPASSSDDPASETAPAAGAMSDARPAVGAPAAGDLSAPEEERGATAESAGDPAGAAGEDRSDTAPEQRAMTSEEAPVRENLEGKPRGFAAVHASRQPEMLAGGIMDAHTSLAHSLYSILDSDADDKPALIKASVQEYSDHVNGLCRKRMQRAEDAEALLQELAAYTLVEKPAAERADKPEGDYGDVHYADPGYQDDNKPRYPLDTKEHAKAAWSYINQAGNASKYSSSQLATIKGKIKAAAEKFGIEISEESERAATIEWARHLGVEGEPFIRSDVGGPYAADAHVLHDAEGSVLGVYPHFLEASAALEKLPRREPAVEASPAEPEQVSRSSEREETPDLARLEAVTAELSRVQAAEQEALQRLAAAEAEAAGLKAEVKRLSDLPVSSQPAIRYYHAFAAEEFIGGDGGDPVEKLKKEIDAFEELAKGEADPGKRQAYVARMEARRSTLLHEYGVEV